MEALKIKKMKPLFNNLYDMGRVVYEATGNEYWLSIAAFAGQSMGMMNSNWFEVFYHYRNEALKELATVDKFTYKLHTIGGKEEPFLYNTL